MSGHGVNSYGLSGLGYPILDQFIPDTTRTSILAQLNYQFSTILSESNLNAEWLDYDETDMNFFPMDSYPDNLNYGPYALGLYRSSLPAYYGNPDYIPISGQYSSSLPADYRETLPGYGLGLYPVNLSTGINGTDANLSGESHSNVKNSYFCPGSALYNNQLVTNESLDEVVQATKIDISGSSSYMSCYGQRNDPTKESKFLREEPASSSTTRLLIHSMLNVSELLLHHCSSETHVLREQDVDSLEKVVDNLNKCMLENIGRESVSKLQQGLSIKKHSGSEDDTFSDSVAVEKCSDMTINTDELYQSIEALIESLLEEKEEERHKFNTFSLMQEALCDDLKIEMGKSKSYLDTDVYKQSIFELDWSYKMPTEVAKDCLISGQLSEDFSVPLQGTTCFYGSGDSYSDDDDNEEEVAAADDEEDDVFYSVMLDDCSSSWEVLSEEEHSKWEFVSKEELSD